MEYKKELDNIEKQVNIYKEEKIRLEEQQKQLELQKVEILKQLEEEGIAEEALQDTINELEMELQEGIAECQTILKSDN